MKFIRNERGIALLIVVLVTALLITLVFEFSYATRISLNNAVNFRDSQRAYFLAMTGINAFKSNYGGTLRKLIPSGQWSPVPLPDVGDTTAGNATIMVKWEAEAGKIKITDVKTDPVVQAMVSKLLDDKQIDRAVYERMIDPASEINKLTVLSGLRAYMSDEDFSKVQADFTVSPVAPRMIDINAASADVLQSMGISLDGVGLIVQNRRETPYTQNDITQDLIAPINGLKIPPATGNFIKTYLIAPAPEAPQMIKVYAYATVGGYTKQVEAIMNGGTVSYWRAL